MKPTVIVGAGISGLSTAYYLAQAGRTSIILDPRPRAGGVIETERAEGCVIEGGPDSFLAAKPEGIALIRELGLEGELIGSNDFQRKTFIRKHGRMMPMPDGLMMVVPTKIMPMALSGLLGWGTKIRMGLEFFRKPGPPHSDRSIAEFIQDHYGQETVDYLAEPLLSGVYGGDPRELSIDSVLPRFADMEKKYGSLTRGVLANRPKQSGGPLFRTLKGGMGQWVDAIIAAIRGKAELRQARADAVERLPGGGLRVKAGGDWLDTENVVLACEAYNAGKLLDGRLAELLNKVGYSSSVLVVFGYDVPQPMPGFGFLIPRKERRQIVAATFVGTKFPHRAPPGLTLVRCFLGGEAEPDVNGIHREFQDLSGISGKPRFHRVFRWPRSMAQYTVGHSVRNAEIQQLVSATPGFHLAGNAYGGIGIPDCVRSGKQAATKIIEK